MTEHHTRRLVAALAGALLLASGCAVSGHAVRWSSADVELSGTLALPRGVGPHPLAVLVPGSGCMPLTHRFVREHAAQLTRRGVAVFVYDKRGCGASGGDWQTVGLAALADDVLAVLPQLAAVPEVDARRVSLMGLSQGAWVALIAAGRTDRLASLVLLSGAPMTPAEQGHAIVELRMQAADWDPASIERAVTLDRLVTQVYRTDSGWEAARAAVQAAAGEPWFRDAGVGIQPRELWNWRWLRRFMDYDPLPALRELELPVLAVNGARDLLVPGPRSQAILADLAPSAAGLRETLLLPEAGHQLRAGKGATWPAEYWQALAQWLTSPPQDG